MLAHLSEENNTAEIVDERMEKLIKDLEFKPKKIILSQEKKHSVEV